MIFRGGDYPLTRLRAKAEVDDGFPSPFGGRRSVLPRLVKTLVAVHPRSLGGEGPGGEGVKSVQFDVTQVHRRGRD